MPEVRLPPVRKGFAYSTDVTFPAGFLQPGETIRASLSRWPGAVPEADFDVSLLGDTFTLSLAVVDTQDLVSGVTYQTELVLYPSATPGVGEVPLTDQLYTIEVTDSPSGA